MQNLTHNYVYLYRIHNNNSKYNYIIMISQLGAEQRNHLGDII